MSVSTRPVSRLRRWCSSRYLRISPLHREFRQPLLDSSFGVLDAISGLSPELSHLTFETTCGPFTPSNSEQRLPPPYYRGCWHGVSRGFLLGYRQVYMVLTYTPIFPYDKGLRPEGLHPPRGVAGSGLRPLPNIPHCCLP
jgi:hypothetical protein